MPDFWIPFIPPLRALAQQAGEQIIAEQRRGISVLQKPDGSPQTNADRAAEAVILAGLAAFAPHIPVIAEESADSCGGFDPAQPFWLVDPLDGTQGFVAGDDDYAISIGLVLNSRPVCGVIHAPARDETFWNDGHGAWRQVGRGVPTPICTRALPAAGMTLLTSRRSQNSSKLRAWMADKTVATHLLLSSALKYGYLAAGLADIYPRFSPTMEWDNAAGEALIKAAGGNVTRLDGTPLVYGQPSLRHDGLIAYGDIQAADIPVPS